MTGRQCTATKSKRNCGRGQRNSLTGRVSDSQPDCGITAAALADLIGVSPRSITDLAKRGIVVRADRGFDRRKSVRGYCDHLRKLATGRGGDAAITTATAAG